MSNDTIDQLKDGTATIPLELSDDDMRQLIIHYATILNNPKGDRRKEVMAEWRSWPKPMYDAFKEMASASANVEHQDPYFWARPAEINIKYGIDR